MTLFFPLCRGRRASVSLLAAAIAALMWVGAGPSAADDIELVGSVWVGGAEGVLKVPISGTALLEIPEAGNVLAVAVDRQRRVVWAYSPPELRSYDFAGQLSLAVPIPATGTRAELVVRASDGSVWLSVDSSLHNVTLGGYVARSVEGPGVVTKLAMYGSSALWAATEGGVTAHDAVSGAQVGSLSDLGSRPKVVDISIDGANLWVALSGNLRWYRIISSGAATLETTVSISGAAFIEHGLPGELWVMKGNELIFVRATSPSNITLVSQGNPLGKGESAIAFATGRTTTSAWIGTNKSRLIHAGLFGATASYPISPPVTIRDLGVFPAETTPPSISIPASWTVDPQKPLIVSYQDGNGSGVDPSTLVVNPSGKVSCDAAADNATCAPLAPWAEGVWNSFTASVRDFAGNYSSQASGGVGLDSVAPSIAITSPADGAVLTDGQTNVLVAYSDGASGLVLSSFDLSVSGGPVSLVCTKTASTATCSPGTGFPDGSYTVIVSIADKAGNRGSATSSFVVGTPVDTTPPSIAFTAPSQGRQVVDRTPLLRLAYGDTGGGLNAGLDLATLRLTSSGTELQVRCEVRQASAGCVPEAPFESGEVTVSAQIADRAGNTTTATVTFEVVEPRVDVVGVATLADGSPAAGAQVFVLDKAEAIAIAASNGAFLIPSVPAYPGELLTVGMRAEMGSAVVAGGVSGVLPVYPTVDVGTLVGRELCDPVYGDVFSPGMGVRGEPSAFGSGATVNAIQAFDDGRGVALFVGGTFTRAGSSYVSYVARWDGVSWSHVGGGMSGEVKDFAVFDDGTGPALYAIGGFRDAGTARVNYVARWDGTEWTALGSGLSYVGFALEVFDDGSGPALYAAGGFLDAGGVLVNRIARWDGYSWTALGEGVDEMVATLQVFDDGSGSALWVGGYHKRAGGQSAPYLARWDGSTWSATGYRGTEIYALGVHDDGSGAALYVGSAFYSGGVKTHFVERWRAGVWETLPLGPAGPVAAWLSFDLGLGSELFTGTQLLRWDGEQWHGVGGGLGGFGGALARDPHLGFPGALLVGGNFLNPGGYPAERLVHWGGDCSPADRDAPRIVLHSPQSGSVTAASTVTVVGSVDEPAVVTVSGQAAVVDASGGFSLGPVALVEGSNSFSVDATDAAGNSARTEVRIVRDTIGPALRFVQPLHGQSVATALPTIELAASDATGVQMSSLAITAGGSPVKVVCAGGSPTIRCSLATPLPSGTITLAARISDGAGNSSPVAQINVQVTPVHASGSTRLLGAVTLLGGAPAPGVLVAVQGQPDVTTVTAADGSFSIPGVLATAGRALAIHARTAGGDTLVGFVSVAEPVVGGTTLVGTIVLRPVCAPAFDAGFVAGFGVDGDYPWKFPDNYNTYFSPQVLALAVFDDGSGPALYVGGTFKMAGGIPANFIAKFDGQRWSPVGDGVRGGGTGHFVQALVVHDDGSGPALYAGGRFSTVDGQTIPRLARWDGRAWSAVGGSPSGEIRALAVWDDGSGPALYAAGEFDSISGVTARNVARWNGTSWSALGSGLGRTNSTYHEGVYALAVHKGLSGKGTTLYAGGRFMVSGSTVTRRIAAWDGKAWVELGGGLGTASDSYSAYFNVASLAVFKGHLYAGGYFNGAGGCAACKAVARWDGRKWNAVGDITSNGYEIIEPSGVQALRVYDDGSGEALYALGSLQQPTLGAGVLRWNGTAWSKPGNGPGASWGGAALLPWADPVEAVTKLFAGSWSVSSWNGYDWRAVGSGLWHDVQALATFDDGSGPGLFAFGEHAWSRMSQAAPPAGSRSPWADLPRIAGRLEKARVLNLGSGPALYVAGAFTGNGPWGGGSVFRWTSGGWAPVGNGLGPGAESEVRDLVVFDSPGGPVLVAGGRIDVIDGVDFNHLAQWDGSSWRPLGTGVTSTTGVTALATHDDGTGTALYVAGPIAYAGGHPAWRIARWNGADWVGVGAGLDGEITHLVSFDDGSGPALYAAGKLSVGGQPAVESVARWDGATWRVSGGVFDAPIRQLTVADDGAGSALVAVGGFTKVDAVAVQRIARWNGSAWTAAGSDLGSGVVYDLTGFDDGTGPALFAGGRFAHGPYGKRTDYGYISDAGEIYYLAKLHRPLSCSPADTVPPALAITSPGDGAVLSTQIPDIAFAYADSGSGVDTSSLEVTANGSSLALSCSYSPSGAQCVPDEPLAEGRIKLRAEIRDGAGNLSPPALVSFHVSVGAPQVTIWSPVQNEVIGSSAVALSLSYSPASLPSTLEVQVAPELSDLSCTHESLQSICTSLGGFADGEWSVTATIRNAAGDVSAPSQVRFWVDTEPPTLAFIAPAAGSATPDTTPTLRLSYSDAGVGADTASLSIAEGGAPLSMSCAWTAIEVACELSTPLAEGQHTLVATLADYSGKSSAPASVTFTVQTEPPTIAFLVPAADAVTNDTTPELRLAYADADGDVDPDSLAISEQGSPLAVTCSHDGGVATCELGSALAFGAHTLVATITDLTGKTSAPAAVSFEVVDDVTGPTIALTSPVDGEATSSEEVTFRGSLDEAGTVTLDGTAVLLDEQNGFAHGPIAIGEGPNRFLLVATDRIGNTTSLTVTVYRDSAAPLLAIVTPRDGSTYSWGSAPIEVRWGDSGRGVDPSSLRLLANGEPLPATCTSCSTGARCTSTGPPAGAIFTLTATVADRAGNLSAAASVQFTTDPNGDITPPTIILTSPGSGTVTNRAETYFVGSVNEPSTLTLSGEPVALTFDGAFRHGPVSLVEGVNAFTLMAIDAAGNSSSRQVTLTLDSQAPTVDLSRVAVGAVSGGRASLTGSTGAVAAADPGTRIWVRNLLTGANVSAAVAGDGGFVAAVPALGGETLSFAAEDAAGNRSLPAQLEVPGAPPEPQAPVAPPLDRSVVTDTCAAVSFLFNGPNAVQLGVDEAAIECARASVVRGRVLDRAGQAIPSVTVSVLRHPELGLTLTRGDGAFDLVVNGGGDVVVAFGKPGLLPVQRRVVAGWHEQVEVPAVVMVAADAAATPVDLTAPSVQVARGSVVSDEDGTRQATLLFLPGTTAQLRHAGGVVEPISNLTVRATEYTVGAGGPAAMPAELPLGTGYTYAVELAADEATASGAVSLDFDQPVPVYLENFLSLPTGTIVPAGYYDPREAAWVPAPNGLVVAVLATGGGLADLDVDGSGNPADAAQLAALGIGEAERQRLAALYAAGQTLWRVPVSHFTSWDFNLELQAGEGAEKPETDEPKGGDGDHDPCSPARPGSIIECTNQILGEVLGVTGSSLTLHYASNRVPGRASAYTLDIALTGEAPPPGLRGVELELSIAGRTFKESFPAAANQRFVFEWDGRDAGGRELQGRERYTLRIGYVYDAEYQEPAPTCTACFGLPGGGPIAPAREAVTLWQVHRGKLGTLDARELWALGGWSLSAHHVYDPEEQILYRGDASQRAAASVKVVKTVVIAGAPTEAVVEPDGSVDYLDTADPQRTTLWRLRPDGEREAVAGGGSQPPAAGLDALLVYFPGLEDLAIGPDGLLYLLDAGHPADTYDTHVWRIEEDGTLRDVLAHESVNPFADVRMTDLRIWHPYEMAIGPDGAIYVADGAAHSWGGNDTSGRMISVLRIDRLAGAVEKFMLGNVAIASNGGETELHFDQHAATGSWVPLVRIGDMQFEPLGDLYFTVHVNCPSVWRRWVTGEVELVAGAAVPGQSHCVASEEAEGDGGFADRARFVYPEGIAVLEDGTVLVADAGDHRIRAIDWVGRVWTVAGSGETADNGDERPAQLTNLHTPTAVRALPSGHFLLTDPGHGRVRSVGSPSISVSATELRVSSEDGGLAYVFSERGRHLRTENAETGQVLLTFAYDDAGRLSTVSDAFANTTTIERESTTGRPLAIVAPFGQRTTLALDGNGFLATVENPAVERVDLTSSADGLLETLRDPNRNLTTFRYDALGRLWRDEDPRGGFTELSRNDNDGGFVVTTTSAEGRVTTYSTVLLASGEKRLTTTYPDGTTSVSVTGADGGGATASYADGSTARMTKQPDPRFGMQAPLPGAVVLTTPQGRTLQASSSQQLQTDSLGQPLRLTANVTVNGKTATTVQDFAARTVTSTSPLGRQGVSQYDLFGRGTRTEVPGLLAVTYEYDPRGRLQSVTQGSRTVTYGYAPSGLLETVTDPLQQTVRYEHDTAGRVRKQVLPDLREVLFGYDANGNLTSITPPARPAHGFVPNVVDLPEQYNAPDVGESSRSTVLQYNLDRQVTRLTRPDGQEIVYGYGAASGRLETMTTPRGVTTYSYEPVSGNLAGVVDPDGGGLSYTYDGSLPLSVTWSGPVAGSIAVTYDNDLRVGTQRLNGDAATEVSFGYDLDGLLERSGALTLGHDPDNGLLEGTSLGTITDAYGYTAYGELESYVASAGGAAVFAEEITQRDGAGRIEQRRETVGGTTAVYDYTYDPAGRLTRVEKNRALFAAYGYDGNSNRETATDPWGSFVGDYDDQDRLLTYGDRSYGYTANGELRSKTQGGQTVTYDYDVAGNLRQVVLSDGVTIEYVIDAANRRVGKRVDGTLVKGFLYGSQLGVVAELDGSGAIVSRFVYGTAGNVPDYMVRGGQTYRIVSDHLGSVRLVVNVADGSIAQTMDYDPFGRVLFDSNPGWQPFGFAGGLYDPQTGLVRFGARDYDAETGRWTAKDPIGFAGGDTNLYGYVLQDPVNAIDPSGHLAPLAIAAIWGAVEVALTIWDVYDTASTLANPCASAADKGVTAGGFMAGLLLPGGGYGTAARVVRIHRHHTIPREVLKRLPPDVARNPLVRGRAGAPNRWPIPEDLHKQIHRGPGGGPYNETFKQRLDALGHEPTVDDVLTIREELVKEFGLQGYRP